MKCRERRMDLYIYFFEPLHSTRFFILPGLPIKDEEGFAGEFNCWYQHSAEKGNSVVVFAE